MSPFKTAIKPGRGLGFFAAVFCCLFLLFGCGGGYTPGTDPLFLTQNTRADLMDWHISGLWVINCPVAWVRITNYNNVPIKEISFDYYTFDNTGKPLDKGNYTIEGTVPPHSTRNFIELYVGLVDLYSERLSIKLVSVHPG